MEDILNEVKKYEISELRKRLIEVGVEVGPITKFSISIFQKRLAKRLFELKGGKLDDDSDETTPISKPVTVDVKDSKTTNDRGSVSDVFYAICMPENIDEQTKNEVNQLVFSDKDLAFKTAKKIKNSRFKVFKSESDALEFSKLTAETAFNSPRKPSTQTEDKIEKSTPVTESSPYKSPKPQELVVLRRAIEFGNTAVFKKCVWDNPRYLVGSGDTPTIYQEGFRYTAMHIAAMKNKPEICQVILDTIENPEFITQLYSQSKQTEETQNSRISFLVDFYLNMPDKGNCESPLHMACKFGFDKVVEVLVNHPKTDRKLKNKYGDSPKDIICTRCNGASAALKERIEMFLEGRSYVPLLRSDDNSTAPRIGRPWSPDKNSPIQNVERAWSPKDPSMSVKAYAGPMSPSNAKSFHKRWTTPPPQSPDQAKQYLHIKRSDSEKGLERIGRQLAHEMKIPWLEYWEFLNAYVDLSSDLGLELFEKYLQKTIWLEYIKAFKDKNNIDRESSEFSTPVKTDKRQELIQSIESVGIKGRVRLSNGSCDNERLNLDALNEISDKTEAKNTEVVSPMTSLAQQFAKIKLLDESWSDRATVDSLGQSTVDENSNEEGDKSTDQSGVSDSIKSGTENGLNIQNQCDKNESNDVTCKTDDDKHEQTLKENDKEIDRTDETSDGENVSYVNEQNTYKEDLNEEIKKVSNIKSEQNQVENEKEKTDEHDVMLQHRNIIDKDTDSTKGENKENRAINNKVTYVMNKSDKGMNKDLHRTKDENNEKLVLSNKDTNKTDKKDKDIEKQHSNLINEDSQKTKGDNESQENVSKLDIKSDYLRQRSTSSDSNDSFKTTAEDVLDPDIAAFHDLDEIDNRVCINVSNNSILDQCKDHIKKKNHLKNSDNINKNCWFMIRLKTLNSCLKVDILSLPEDDVYTCSDMLMLEDVDVSSCEGDIGASQEGDIVEIGSGDSKSRHDGTLSPVYGYLSRAVTLPKVAYLYGPQPTREDLDVSRALGDAIIVPDIHPNVFQWKIRLAKFLKDTNYRWQSPAKVRTKFQQGSPVPSPLRNSSPIIQYGSPLGLHSPQRGSVTPDIRTRLFPAIAE